MATKQQKFINKITTIAVPITNGFNNICFINGIISFIFIIYLSAKLYKNSLATDCFFQYHLNMLGIVNYNAGNIKSVQRALDSIKAQYVLSKNPKDLENCDRVIFPGVGDAAYAMTQLKQTGFDIFLKDWVASGKKLAGICLGSQIIFDYSEEGNVECLGLLKGKIRHFSQLCKEANITEELKFPHMGWNNISFANGGSSLFDGVKENTDFYFVHSYVICPEDESVVKAYADYGIKVPACIEKDNITVFQFHPEKSGTNGIQILRNFCK